eukprot:CAMPEP_0174931012 /NCGR_PEP_ID=MMETSP1355-20121228/31899_1 /TAXON_ID=464990 /ORGANISM="Hemiselmis tepida, Strain CCMP443" /LENGTH=93 /DNA_ID=CAMNT_0016177335 /DNA_START=152 /DNA_END=433 /DNA_ORIENTATION=+
MGCKRLQECTLVEACELEDVRCREEGEGGAVVWRDPGVPGQDPRPDVQPIRVKAPAQGLVEGGRDPRACCPQQRAPPTALLHRIAQVSKLFDK